MEFFGTIHPVWIWLVVALGLLALEVLLNPEGVLLCIATAAGIVAGIVLLIPMPWTWSLSLFAALTGVACYGWWKFTRSRGAQQPDKLLNAQEEKLIGYTATLSEGMRDGKGRIRVNDTSWPVSADEDFPAGTKVIVTKVDGITLLIKKRDEK